MFKESDLLVELRCFDNGVILRKRDNGKLTEYPIDPTELVRILVRDTIKPERFSTGLISNTLLYYSKQAGTRVIAEYRPPQVYGLWLDGSEEPLKVPLPGLVMICNAHGKSASYRVFAVKSRPTKMDELVFEPPLPNVTSGRICWGSTKQTPLDEDSIDLSVVWMTFFSTPFGNHGVKDKSTRDKYKDDIRLFLIELSNRQAKTYPLATLVEIDRIGRFLE